MKVSLAVLRGEENEASSQRSVTLWLVLVFCTDNFESPKRETIFQVTKLF
jgi:hypothetical protein